MTPDAIIFVATLFVLTLMGFKGRNMLATDKGYRWVVGGVSFVTIAGFLDTVSDWILWSEGTFFASPGNQELIITSFFYGPGIVGIGYGLASWVPKVMALDGEIILREAKEQELRRSTDALKVAKSEAERASQVKSEFLAMMSHEIRTPLNGVIGMTEVLQSSDLSEKQRSMTEVISSSGVSLLNILNDILDISKLEAGHSEVHVCATDLEEVVGSATRLMEPVASEKGVTLAVDFSEMSEAAFYTDEGKVQQVVSNLLGNAIKFTDNGAVLVRVSELDEERDEPQDVSELNRSVRVEVKDNGIGIAPDKQTKLFQRFVQADSSTSRQFGGTGLGLAICKELILLLDGDIGCDSKPGQGSTFWFTLPCQGRAAGSVDISNEAVA